MYLYKFCMLEYSADPLTQP